ncbi:hypothetical protein M6B38_190880 [Iris pallida]|uniref:Uncharacterized protein n=1 Tax=Iris pallida TaxID=29817 RepID=A0AAX6EF02_IRIPA|nr:hypothetical protein M6B38_190880 [Iris pallida]
MRRMLTERLHLVVGYKRTCSITRSCLRSSRVPIFFSPVISSIFSLIVDIISSAPWSDLGSGRGGGSSVRVHQLLYSILVVSWCGIRDLLCSLYFDVFGTGCLEQCRVLQACVRSWDIEFKTDQEIAVAGLWENLI